MARGVSVFIAAECMGQIKRMMEAQERSKDRHKRILMRVREAESKRGGLFETQWMRGKGCWVRTRKQKGRNLWIESMDACECA